MKSPAGSLWCPRLRPSRCSWAAEFRHGPGAPSSHDACTRLLTSTPPHKGSILRLFHVTRILPISNAIADAYFLRWKPQFKSLVAQPAIVHHLRDISTENSTYQAHHAKSSATSDSPASLSEWEMGTQPEGGSQQSGSREAVTLFQLST